MSYAREVLTMHFGQAGVQIGDAVWQAVCGEHSIDPEGHVSDQVGRAESTGLKTFFHAATEVKYIPRTLLVDTEPTVIDEIRTGYFRNLFHPDLMITGIEDAANNFARGFYSLGEKMIYPLIEKCRYITETCDNFQGFISYAGSGGGTGSGLFTMFLERALIEYSSKIFIGNIIVPGKTMSNCVVDPYNTVFKLTKSFGAEDLNFILDNQSLYSICTELDIVAPTYHNLNKVLAPLFSTITAPIRFGGSLTGALNEISTNLIPYPRINFPTMSYTPFMPSHSYSHNVHTCKDLTMSLFDQKNNLIGEDLCKGFFMSSVLIYRGGHIINHIIDSINFMKDIKKFRWVDWCPTGFKITQTDFPALHCYSSAQTQPSKSILMLTNHSGVINKFEQESRKFILLFRKRSYLHWYLNEGMEEMEFEDALDDLLKIKIDYEFICCKKSNDESSKDYISTEKDIKVDLIAQHMSETKLTTKSTSTEMVEESKKKYEPNISQKFVKEIVKTDSHEENNKPKKSEKLVKESVKSDSHKEMDDNNKVSPEDLQRSSSLLDDEKESSSAT